MKSTNQIICEYVAANPLCTTAEVAAHIGRDAAHTSKVMYQLEAKDYLRCPTKQGHNNTWIRGTNDSFRRAGAPGGQGNYRGIRYEQNGAIGRKRLVTVTVNAADAIALIKNGFSTMTIV